MLFLQPRLPVEYHGHRRSRPFVHRDDDQKPAVGGDVVLGAVAPDRLDASENRRSEKGHRTADLRRGFSLDGHRHELTIESKIEQFLAIPRPPWVNSTPR